MTNSTELPHLLSLPWVHAPLCSRIEMLTFGERSPPKSSPRAKADPAAQKLKQKCTNQDEFKSDLSQI
jgi:hypothetical protein